MFVEYNMKFVFSDEVYNKSDLESYIENNELELPEYRSAVIAVIKDKDGKFIMQKRGPKSRDEFGKYQHIGGAVEDIDNSFVDALKREINEEVGSLINYEIKGFVGAFLSKRYDSRTDSIVNWLFFVYDVMYISGELLFNEDGKCESYDRFSKDEFPIELISYNSKVINEYYVNYYKNNN